MVGGSSTVIPRNTLLAESVARVEKRLAAEDCAKAIGAKTSAAAIKKVSSTPIGFSDLGVPTYKTVGGQLDFVSGPVVKAWPVFFFGNIKLNTNINWEDLSQQTNIQDGRTTTSNFLANNARSLGVSAITSTQYMDLTVLHELGHLFGMNSQDKDERPIWTNCFK